MSNRDWLHGITFGFCVVLGITFGLVAVYYSQPIPWRILDDAAAAKADYEARRSASAPDDAIKWIGDVKSSSPKDTAERLADAPDKSSDYHDALDLEAQWAAAAAGERMARLAVWQLVFGGLGIVAVGWSLYYTRKALELSRKSADAAEESIAVARESAERELRAYLSMTPNKLGGLYEGGTVSIEFKPVNHGQSPAFRMRHVFEIRTLSLPLPDDFIFEEPTRIIDNHITIFPNVDTNKTWFNAKATTTQGELEEIRNKRAGLFCWGTTFYEDIFGKQRTVNFRVYFTGQNVADSQKQYHEGKKEDLPEWDWIYASGHGDAT
ncbi:hypothetical protein [Ferrovibrio sp.]|uniref:hypothetical protein n=1 Tax=Ferrovibrio sp. TaxID=1917215 RepID=UPI003D0C7298